MKLRWSNGRSHAETFEANDLESFINNGMAALRVFRAATYRKVHRGEIHKGELWFDNPELHAEVNERWMAPGKIKKIPSGLNFFEPMQTRFAISAPTLEDIFESDRQWFNHFAADVWQGVCDVYQWSGALDAMIMTTGDKVERVTQEQRSQAAAMLGRKGGQSTSEAKAAAARKNAKKGGWPKGRPRKKANV